MSDNHKNKSTSLLVLEILLRIGIAIVLIYAAFGLIYLLINGKKGRSDFPVYPILFMLCAGSFIMHQSFSKIRKVRKQINLLELDRGKWTNKSYPIQQKLFLVSSSSVVVCLTINVLTETFGVEAFILILILIAFLVLAVIYLKLLNKKLKLI